MIPTLPRNPPYAIIGVRATDHSLVADDGFLSAWLGLPLQNILPNRSNPNADLPKTPTGLRGWLVRSTYGRMDLRRAEWHGWKPGNLSAADVAALSNAGREKLVGYAEWLAGLQGRSYYGYIVLCNTGANAGACGTSLIGQLIRQSGQRYWQCCFVCRALVFYRQGGSGRCPAGAGTQPHTLDPTWNTYQPNFASGSSQPVSQDVKRLVYWCSACDQLWLKNSTSSGVCPARAGGHIEASSGGRYDVDVATAHTDAIGYERGWGVCADCRAVAHFGSPAAKSGLCPARLTDPEPAHQPLPNLTLAVPMEHSSSPEFMAHELGHTLGLQHMHSTQLTRYNGNDSAAGAYGEYGDVMGWGARPAVQFGSAAMPYAAAGALVQGWIPEDKVVRRSWSPGQTVEVALSDPESSGTAPHLLVLRAPNATYGIELEEASTNAPTPQPELLQVRRTHMNFAAGRASFMNCTRCGGLFDVHDRVCAAGGVHYTPDPRVHHIAHGAAAGADWRYCKRCSMLWRPGAGAQGCPAGGEHSTVGSGQYSLTYSPTGGLLRQCQGCGAAVEPAYDTNGDGCTHGTHVPYAGGLTPSGEHYQDGWRTCRRCAGVVFTGDLRCPNGGAHHFSPPGNALGSLVYSLETGSGLGEGRFWGCTSCKGVVRAPGACANGGTHQYDPSRAPFVVPAWEDRWAFSLCTTCHTLVRLDGGKSYQCSRGSGHTLRDYFMFKMTDLPRLNTQDALAFPCCNKCGGLYDPERTAATCPAGGRHEEAPAGQKPKRYVATRNRWTLPCFCFVVCTSCGRLHPEHTDPNANKACLGTSGHTDHYKRAAFFFGWSAFRTEAQLEPWSDCTRCGLLVRMSATGSRCAAGGEHTVSGRRFDPTERRLEWGMVRLATETNPGRGVERSARGDWDALTVELTRSGGVNTVKVR